MLSVYYACVGIRNFGDLLTPWLVEQIIGVEPEFSEDRELIISGSVLQEAKENTIVMGAGFGSLFQRCDMKADIRYVRGHYSRFVLQQRGYDVSGVRCHEPALLLPEFFDKSQYKQEHPRILPHYVDWKLEMMNDDHVIDICSGVENVVKKILTSTEITTSSLHGMVACHAFGIPCRFEPAFNNVDTDGFKYLDYYSLFDHNFYHIAEEVNTPKVSLSENKRFLNELKSILQ